MEKIKVGISSCLLGNKVRFDGQHKLDRYITGTLSRWCDFVPVCPEVECGLPVPRESMRLVGDPQSPRLITGKTGVDHTDRMEAWMAAKWQVLDKADLVAFIFKSKSPSSGMFRVKVYNREGQTISHSASGLFAAAFTKRYPDIPVEEEGRLHDPVLRENFIETIFIMQKWRNMIQDYSASGFIHFHQSLKYSLMAHNQALLKKMGKITASPPYKSDDEEINLYRKLLLEALKSHKTIQKNHNVLLHMIGYFKKSLTADEKQEIIREANMYYEGLNPLIVPLTLIRHYTRKYDETYLAGQHFLNPHPAELGLLNHV